MWPRLTFGSHSLCSAARRPGAIIINKMRRCCKKEVESRYKVGRFRHRDTSLVCLDAAGASCGSCDWRTCPKWSRKPLFPELEVFVVHPTSIRSHLFNPQYAMLTQKFSWGVYEDSRNSLLGDLSDRGHLAQYLQRRTPQAPPRKLQTPRRSRWA
jgi:hypothetical protein